MALYEYLCTNCGSAIISTQRADKLRRICLICGNGEHQRKWSISFKRSMPEHFNRTVNRPVSNERQFADALKQGSEDYFNRTGIETKFAPIDMDPATCGVTTEGLSGAAVERVNKATSGASSRGAAPALPELPKTAGEAKRVAEEFLSKRPHVELPEPANDDESLDDLPAER